MSLRDFSEQFQLIYSPGVYFEWFLLNTFLRIHQHFSSCWAMAVPGFAWCPLRELFPSPPVLPVAHRFLQPPSSADSACSLFWMQPLHISAARHLWCKEAWCHQPFNLWELSLIIYNAMQCLTGRVTVQGVFNSSNHEDYSRCSLVSESSGSTAWAPLHSVSWCRCLSCVSAHQLTTHLDTGRGKCFAVKAVQAVWCLFRKVEIVKRLPQNLIYFSSKKVQRKFLDYISHRLNWMGRL